MDDIYPYPLSSPLWREAGLVNKEGDEEGMQRGRRR